MSRYLLRIPTHLSLSKKSGWSWAFSDRYGRMDKGDKRCRFATQWGHRFESYTAHHKVATIRIF